MIVSSTFTRDNAQMDGRFWVAETHVDDQGNTYGFNYLCAVSDDPQAIMTQRAADLDAGLQS